MTEITEDKNVFYEGDGYALHSSIFADVLLWTAKYQGVSIGAATDRSQMERLIDDHKQRQQQETA